MSTDSTGQSDPMAQPMSPPAAWLGALQPYRTHQARIVGPVAYRSGTGRKQHIPIGPCLVESLGGRSIDIVWGARGQSCVALPLEEIEAAKEHGYLLLLD